MMCGGIVYGNGRRTINYYLLIVKGIGATGILPSFSDRSQSTNFVIHD
jgi:hypothetical protein